MSQEQDRIFFRNFTLVLVALVCLVIAFATIGILLGDKSAVSPAEARAEVMENTRPVAKVNREDDMPASDATAEAPIQVAEATTETVAADIGETTYQSACLACHGSGIPNIPQLGDATAWAPRIAQGKDILYERAINGFIGTSSIPMPAKGGNPSLSDDAVKAAVDYMIVGSQ